MTNMKNNIKPKNNFSKMIIVLIFSSLILSGCGSKDNAPTEEKRSFDVKVQKASDSKKYEEKIELPAMVLAQQEAKIVAKMSGHVADLNIKIGDQVKMGDTLMKIDDAGKTKTQGNVFNSEQIKQAQIGVEQALASFQMAQNNYYNLLNSSAKDLKQAEIARDQAQTGKSNLNITTSETLKSAEISYETAKLATEQAKQALENRKKISGQSINDLNTNANTTADAVVNGCNTIITSINNLIAFDTTTGVNVPYSTNFGALDSKAYDNAKNSYYEAKSAYDAYLKINFSDPEKKADEAAKLVVKVKDMTDKTKYLLEKTITSSALPLTSLTGPSLSSLQSTVAGFQSSINASLSQIQGVKQAFNNLDLNTSGVIESLEKGYELAKKQEASAKQNLANLQAGNVSQKDIASFSVQAADNQYEAVRSKLDSQISVSKSQMDLAQLQYSNALTALQNLYDAHTAITPIDGIITKKSVENGDTVAAGQLLAVVSQPDSIKFQAYIDQSILGSITTGSVVEFKDQDGRSYPAKISSIALQADTITKRFLVEVVPDNAKDLILGTVINIVFPITKRVQNDTNVLLPLSCVNIGQNENYIFINDNDRAKKIQITIVKVEGEFAEVQADIRGEQQIITDGAKMINEGDSINIIN